MTEKIAALRQKETVIFYGEYTTGDVAAIIPAHNEEKTIKKTIRALLRVLPQKNIYVASDSSADKTNKIVREMKIKLFDIQPNKGKARAIVSTMKRYRLLSRYKLIFINDADTEIDRNYFALALPLFADPHIAAIATHGKTRKQKYSFWQKYFIAYRMRLWRIIQVCMRFGQTWKYTNVSFIIPGSSSLYRTDVIRQLEIDAPGLVIEDFNMTFELHKKKLGKIAYHPHIFSVHQDPYTLRDYVRQVQRWNLGFFQTVKRHGVWPSIFWLATTAYYVELYLFAVFFVFMPVLLCFLLIRQTLLVHTFFVTYRFTLIDVLIGIFAFDYLFTVITAIVEKDVSLLFYGLGFIFLRYIDAVLYVFSPIRAFFQTSGGTWKSPKRL